VRFTDSPEWFFEDFPFRKMSNSRITERLIKSKGRIRKIPKGMEEILADVSDPDV
jgi:hypothetical protein